MEHVYYRDPTLQRQQWEICTIVQQCLMPDYGLSVGRLTPEARTKFFEVLAYMLSDESYKRILTQHLSNLLLGEMQTWAVTCPGKCAELDDPSGLLPSDLLMGGELRTTELDLSYDECAKLRFSGRFTLWQCDDAPRMLHHGNMDTKTGRCARRPSPAAVATEQQGSKRAFSAPTSARGASGAQQALLRA